MTTTPPAPDWPAALRQIRAALGLSQAGLAERWAPVSKRTLQDWEQGRCQPESAAQALIRLELERIGANLGAGDNRLTIISNNDATT